MKKQYDVVIIGGGIVGLTLACALGSRSGINNRLQIAVIEAREPDDVHHDDDYDLRV